MTNGSPGHPNDANRSLSPEAARELLGSLVTSAAPRDRDVEAARARARNAARFGGDDAASGA